MPYQINGHTQFIESLPGTGTISHQFQPHHYDLKCGDVYLVTADGNIMFIGMDSEQSQCCWNSRTQGLYPSYYRPVHAQRPDAYAQCLEETQNPQFAYTEDCLMVLLCPAGRLHQRSNYCVVFRHGSIIYQGKCDPRGVFYNHSRGGSNKGGDNIPTIRQEYQWRRASLVNGELVDDPNGKYCGTGTVKDKTWDWVTLKSRYTSEYDVTEKQCAGWVINGQKPNWLEAWYSYNCLVCPGESGCDSNSIPNDNGQFARHDKARNFSVQSCTGDDLCYCRMATNQGVETVDNEAMEYGAYMTDLGAGFALIPLKNPTPRFADFTYIGDVTDASQLPGNISGDLNRLDWDSLRDYEVNYMDMTTGTIINPDPDHNTSTVTRTGIQYNDVFRMGDSYYKFTYNGWKFYPGRWQKDYVERKWGAYLLVTPDNGGSLMDENGCPNEEWIVKGVNINKCGTEWVVVNDIGDPASGTDGRYFLLNLKTGNKWEGSGNASISCLYCWAVVNVNGVSSIYGSTGVLYSTPNPIRGLSHYARPYTDDDKPFMFLKVHEYGAGGEYTTVLKCDSNLGTWHTGTWVSSTPQVSLQYINSRFLGLYNIDNQHVIVIEVDTIVYDDIGIIVNYWGQSIGAVRTGQFISMYPDSTTLALYRTVDLIAGEDGYWVGSPKDGSDAIQGNINPNDYTVFSPSSLGRYVGQQNHVSVNINPDDQGNRQQILIGMRSPSPTIEENIQLYYGGSFSWVSGYSYIMQFDNLNIGDHSSNTFQIIVIKVTYQGNSSNILDIITLDVGSVTKIKMAEMIEYDGSTLQVNSLKWPAVMALTNNYAYGLDYLLCTTNMPADVAGVFIMDYEPKSGIVGVPTTLNAATITSGSSKRTLGEYSPPPPTDVIPDWVNVVDFTGAGTVQSNNSNAYPYALTNCKECQGKSLQSNPECQDAYSNGLYYGSYNTYYSQRAIYEVPYLYKNRHSPPKFLSIYKDGRIEWDTDASGQADVLTEPLNVESCETAPVVSGTCKRSTCGKRNYRTQYTCGKQQACRRYLLIGFSGMSSANGYNGDVVYNGKNNSNTPYAGIDKINITGCCDDGIVGHAIVTYNKIKETILNEDLFIDGQKVASQSFNPANSTSVSSVGSCRCGFVYATLGYQDKVTGDITYTVEPAYYTNTGLERITSALQIPPEMEQDIALSCCDGYGWALASKRAEPVISWGTDVNPLIPRKEPQYTPPAVTDANLETYLNDPRCTVATFDDGTKAVGRWGAHFMTYCDETDAGADRWVDTWHFRGIDGVFKTVQNPYRLQHNPMGAMDTNQSWVPFARTKPEGMSAVFRITEDGLFDGLIANDTDIIAARCNFYNTDDKRYDGIDVTTQVGDLDHDFNVSMTWPDPNEVICEPGTVIEYSTLAIRKTINNPYNTGRFDTVEAQPFMRYGQAQSLRSNHVGEKGVLTNTQYHGRMEIIDTSVKTGTHSDYDKLEQKSRTKEGQGHYYTIANDREAIKPADELMGFSTATVVTNTVVKDLKINLPYPEYDQQRAVFSENGVLNILDKDLGLLKYDLWGNLLT